jgi:hypothetical protein
MSAQPKSLMTYYAEGQLISRELNQMLNDYAADGRFEAALADDAELYAERKASYRELGAARQTGGKLYVHKRDPFS